MPMFYSDGSLSEGVVRPYNCSRRQGQAEKDTNPNMLHDPMVLELESQMIQAMKQ